MLIRKCIIDTYRISFHLYHDTYHIASNEQYRALLQCTRIGREWPCKNVIIQGGKANAVQVVSVESSVHSLPLQSMHIQFPPRSNRISRCREPCSKFCVVRLLHVCVITEEGQLFGSVLARSFRICGHYNGPLACLPFTVAAHLFEVKHCTLLHVYWSSSANLPMPAQKCICHLNILMFTCW